MNTIQIKTETKTMSVGLMQFDRLLHANKLWHNGKGWEFVSSAVNRPRMLTDEA